VVVLVLLTIAFGLVVHPDRQSALSLSALISRSRQTGRRFPLFTLPHLPYSQQLRLLIQRRAGNIDVYPIVLCLAGLWVLIATRSGCGCR
jgi:hypothetical protein